MIQDFLKHHDIPYPAHLSGWEEREYCRVLRFKGPVTGATIPGMLRFRDQMDRAGLPTKHLIFDGRQVTEVDSLAVAGLLVLTGQKNQRIGLINTPEALQKFLATYPQRDKIEVFESEAEAVAAFNTRSLDQALPAAHPLRKNKALTLLLALVLFLIALPFFETNLMGILYLLFFNAVLLAGIYAVSYNVRHLAGGVLLATPTLITAWSNVFLKSQQILNAEMVFLTIFLIYTIVIILGHILSVKKVTINELYGGFCVYIMVGMTFGVIYALLYSLDPSSLGFPDGETAPVMTSFFYFSFVSMTSTGFSGITAVSPFARAIAIVQVILGVMYISALIGKLVSANTPDDDGLFDNMEVKLHLDVWGHELTEHFFKRRIPLLVVSMAMLNYASSVLMTVLHLPFFMDSWGTSLAVVLGGVWAGILAGVIYNLVMALTFWDPSAWVWLFCNVLIALSTGLFLRRGWINLHKPFRLLAAGVISGILNSAAVWIITNTTGLPIYQGTMTVYHFFMNLTGNPALASIAEKAAVEVADKTIALMLVAVAVIFIRDYFNWNKRGFIDPNKPSPSRV